jgi:predicted RNA-binding protein with PIN domain
MSLQYIIDGYNLIHHPLFNKYTAKKSKDSRIALLDFIKINRLCGSPKNKITVIFDGYPDLSARNLDSDEINVIFSRSQTADERIKGIVEKSGNPKNVVVVSDDNEIRFMVKSIGAKVLSVEEFLSRKEKLQARIETLAESKLTYSQMHKINQELRKIWLK